MRDETRYVGRVRMLRVFLEIAIFAKVAEDGSVQRHEKDSHFFSALFEAQPISEEDLALVLLAAT